jgi:Sigma-70 region 2
MNFEGAARQDEVTDSDLLARGDASSFAEFYRRHARRLAGYLMRMTGDAEVAADLTAETFAAALGARESFQPERAKASTWLYGIAAHKLSDWQRRRRPGWRPAGRLALAFAASIVVAALVLAPVLVVLGGGAADTPAGSAGESHAGGPPPVGTVIERGDETRIVVATGTAPVGGPWQLEAYAGERAARCLSLLLRDEAIDHGSGGHASCDEGGKPPGFTLHEHFVPHVIGAGPVREMEVYGTVPEDAKTVELTGDRGVRERMTPFEGPAAVRGDF